MPRRNGPRFTTALLALTLAFFTMAVLVLPAPAQTYNILHSFAGPDGSTPNSGVVGDAAGNLYGTTPIGGTGDCNGDGCGTIYRLTKMNGMWAETVIHSFQGSDGQEAETSPTLDASGNVFAATARCTSGCQGTVVELTPQQNGSWSATVLHGFSGSPDGSNGLNGLVLDPATGTLYGATAEGGIGSDGTVYSFSGAGYSNYSLLYSFHGHQNLGGDGDPTFQTLVRDAAGNLYGTGVDAFARGTIFRLSATRGGGWTETILYRFINDQNGRTPFGGLTLDAAGNIYGATYDGGPYQFGVIYKLSPNSGGTWTYTVLYAFHGGSDGSYASSAPALDAVGNIYGTTQYGGTASNGTVFKLTPSGQGQWTKTTLHNFSRLDGAVPQLGKLWIDSQGNLYGTTILGGVFGRGVVFRITQ